MIADSQKQLEELEAKLESAKTAESPTTSDSQNVERKAKRKSLKRSAALNEIEKAWLESHAEVFPKQRDLSLRKVTRLKKLATAWQEVITQYRTAESERQAAEARRKVSEAHPALKQFAERNAVLAEERSDLAARLDANRGYLKDVRKTLEELQKDFGVVTNRVKVVGRTPTIGLLLRNRSERLPDRRAYLQRTRLNSGELQRVQMAMFDLQTERNGMGDLEETIEKVTAELGGTSLPNVGPEKARQMVREIMEARQHYIDKLLIDYDSYHDDLSDLEVVIHQLLAQIRDYRSYIDEHVLWIRSAPAFSTASVGELGSSARGMLDSRRGLLAVPGVVVARVKSQPLYSLLLVAGLVTLFVVRRLLAHRIELHGAAGSKPWWSTLMQLAGPVILALPGPVALWAVALWLGSRTDHGTSWVTAQALHATAGAWFVAAVLSGGFRRNGIAEGLLGFDADSTKVVRRQLSVFQSLIVPLVFPLAWLAATHDPRSGARAGTRAVHHDSTDVGLPAASSAASQQRRLVQSAAASTNQLAVPHASGVARGGHRFSARVGFLDRARLLLHRLATADARPVDRGHDGRCLHLVCRGHATASRAIECGTPAGRILSSGRWAF